MTIKYNSARQEVRSALLRVKFSDLVAADFGVAERAIEVPSGAVVTGGELIVVTAFNSTTNTLSLGDAASATRYATTVDLKTAARTALTLTGYKHLNTESLLATLVQTGALPTAGEFLLRVEYVQEGRASSTQGLDLRAGVALGA